MELIPKWSFPQVGSNCKQTKDLLETSRAIHMQLELTRSFCDVVHVELWSACGTAEPEKATTKLNLLRTTDFPVGNVHSFDVDHNDQRWYFRALPKWHQLYFRWPKHRDWCHFFFSNGKNSYFGKPCLGKNRKKDKLGELPLRTLTCLVWQDKTKSCATSVAVFFWMLFQKTQEKMFFSCKGVKVCFVLNKKSITKLEQNDEFSLWSQSPCLKRSSIILRKSFLNSPFRKKTSQRIHFRA